MNPIPVSPQLSLPVSLIPSLDVSKDEIRLLKVHPGKEYEVIQCQYMVVSLNDGPKYQTVSYVWCDPGQTRKIQVNGMQYVILESLFAALMRIRKLDEAIILWTDALCINQADAIEKTQQVNMMHRIYRECSNCFIWLGEVDIDGDKGASAVNAAAAGLDMIRVCSGDILENDLPISITSPRENMAGSRALEVMMKANWWLRIWTVQEACLPPRSLVLWGPLSIQWESLIIAANNLVFDTLPFTRDFDEMFPSDIATAFPPAMMGIKYALNWVADEVPLLECIWRFRYRLATDPRDKLYGIKSLMGSTSLPSIMSCDYTLDTRTVFTRITLDLLRDEGGLRTFIGWRGEKHMTPGLPTWALDLTRPTSGLEMTARVWDHSTYWPKFAADTGLPMLDTDNLTSADESLLFLTGVYVDRVAIIGEAMLEESEDYELTVTDLEPNIDVWRDTVVAFTNANAEKHGVNGMLRSAMINGMTTSFDSLIEGSITEDEEDDGLWKKAMCKNQALLITDTGYIGLGPHNTRVGDEVWVLAGGRLPFVLRPCEQSSNEGAHDLYEFIGDCFMCGAMFGEAVEGKEDLQRRITLR